MYVYKKMYLALFNAVTDALAALDRRDPTLARQLLVEAQRAAEETFLNEAEDED